MKKTKLLVLAGLAASVTTAIFLTGCKKAASERIVTQGSTTVLPVAQKAAEVFMQKNPEADITVRGGGSGTGIAALIDGICDIAMSSREMKEEEYAKAKEKGVTPHETIIAIDGLAVIVHPSNSVNGLSLSQIKDIYTGKISRWGEIGGSDEKIVVVSRDVASGTYEYFSEEVLKEERVRADSLLQASNMAVAGTVSRTPNAIGYVGLAYLSDSVKAIAIDGVMPSFEATVKGEYFLARPLFMYTDGSPKGIVRDFINFILSEEGQKVAVKDVGFVPVK